MRKNNGFTVVELLVTLAVMAVLIVLSVNLGHSALERTDFTNAFNQFVSDYSYGRMLAVRENRNVAFVFNEDNASYTILLQNRVTADNWEKEEERALGLSESDINEDNYSEVKTVSPLEGEAFFDNAYCTDFVINSMGVIRAYPLSVSNNPPISVNLTFFTKYNDGSYDEKTSYEKTIKLYPSGGIKIEK